MKTNAMMIKELAKEFNPETYGILSGSEANAIREKLELSGRDILDLRNLRDMVVIWFTAYGERLEPDAMRRMDKLSGITAVIDGEIWNKGGEV